MDESSDAGETRLAAGRYRVVAESGVVPRGLSKRMDGRRGWTCLGPLPLLPFRLEEHGAGLLLRYRGPLGFLVDELTPELDGTWSGVARCLGVRYGRFRLEQ